MKSIRIANLVCVLGLALVSPAINAIPVVIAGGDPGANSSNPRPLSNAAAAAFDAAVPGASLITFESAPVGSFTTLVVAPGVTIGTGQEIRNTPINPSADALFGYNTTTGGTQFVSLSGGTLTFTFATPIQAFGAYFSGIQRADETMTFNDGTTQVVPLVALTSGVEFVGFTNFGNPFSNVTVNVQFGDIGDVIGIDDVRYSSAPGITAVPEPGAGFLVAIALAGLYMTRLRKKA